MEVQTNRVPIKTPELVASILKQGGKLLLVGDGILELPKQIVEHPQIICWDYSKNEQLENKEVPSNVKIIMYNRWISHSLAKRLHNAAVDLHAIKFPMLRTREIKEMLAQISQAEPVMSVEDVEKEIETITSIENIPSEPVIETIVEEDMPKKKDTGRESPVRDFVVKNMKLNIDYTVKGTKVVEAKRLFDLAKKEGIKSTLPSMANTVGVVIKQIAKNKAGEGLKSELKPAVSLADRVKPAKKTHGDDFDVLEVYIEDAIKAMKLVAEHLPKVKKETEKLRAMREKVMKLFE